jgi:hypothetical protein
LCPFSCQFPSGPENVAPVHAGSLQAPTDLPTLAELLGRVRKKSSVPIFRTEHENNRSNSSRGPPWQAAPRLMAPILARAPRISDRTSPPRHPDRRLEFLRVFRVQSSCRKVNDDRNQDPVFIQLIVAVGGVATWSRVAVSPLQAPDALPQISPFINSSRSSCSGRSSMGSHDFNQGVYPAALFIERIGDNAWWHSITDKGSAHCNHVDRRETAAHCRQQLEAR